MSKNVSQPVAGVWLETTHALVVVGEHNNVQEIFTQTGEDLTDVLSNVIARLHPQTPVNVGVCDLQVKTMLTRVDPSLLHRSNFAKTLRSRLNVDENSDIAARINSEEKLKTGTIQNALAYSIPTNIPDALYQLIAERGGSVYPAIASIDTPGLHLLVSNATTELLYNDENGASYYHQFSTGGLSSAGVKNINDMFSTDSHNLLIAGARRKWVKETVDELLSQTGELKTAGWNETIDLHLWGWAGQIGVLIEELHKHFPSSTRIGEQRKIVGLKPEQMISWKISQAPHLTFRSQWINTYYQEKVKQTVKKTSKRKNISALLFLILLTLAAGAPTGYNLFANAKFEKQFSQLDNQSTEKLITWMQDQQTPAQVETLLLEHAGATLQENETAWVVVYTENGETKTVEVSK